MRRRHSDPGVRDVMQRHELAMTRRVTGAVQGEYNGLFPGPGSEAGESRPYVPGDDVRLIDWNITARTNIPHVRYPISDHELQAWIVVDISPSQGFGSRGGEKRELALFAAASFGFAASQQANRVAGVIMGGAKIELIPPRSGEAHLLGFLENIADQPRPEADGRTELKTTLARAAAYAIQPGFVVVISDFLVQPGWERELQRLSQRHTVVAVEVVDPLELELPAVGRMHVEDPETGDSLLVDTSDASLRERYRVAAAAQRDEIKHNISWAGAEHLQLRTDHDWFAQVMKFFQERRQRNYGYRKTP